MSDTTAEGLTQGEREHLHNTLRNVGWVSWLPTALERTVERILADRLAAVQTYPEAERSYLSVEWERLAKSAVKRADAAEAERDAARAEVEALRADVQEVIDARCRGDFAALLPKLRAALEAER